MGLLRVRHDWVTSFHFSLSCIGEGNGNPLQCSCLENPGDGGAWWAAVSGVAQSRTRLKRLSRSSSSSMLLAYVTPPRPNLRVCLGFSVCPLGLSFHFVWYSQISFVIFETFNDVKWRKGIGKKKTPKPCLLLSKSGTFSGRKGSTSFLKSPKVTNRSKINIYKKCLVI